MVTFVVKGRIEMELLEKATASFRQNSAFTLAEVLITLGIIGVVAALTIPVVMNNANEKETIVSLKKSYSILTSAYTQAVQDNGTPDLWGADPLVVLKPYLKISKDCTTTLGGCFSPGVTYKFLNGGNEIENDSTGQTAVQLADGSSLMYQNDSSDCTGSVGDTQALQAYCGQIYVDINGNKRPNQWGIDAFIFHFTKFGIVPFGTAPETRWPFSAECHDISKSGYSCSGWVIYNENMDYKRCDDLAWDGKHKC